MIKGRNGIFEVRVGDTLVAKKGPEGFPDEEETAYAVALALAT